MQTHRNAGSGVANNCGVKPNSATAPSFAPSVTSCPLDHRTVIRRFLLTIAQRCIERLQRFIHGADRLKVRRHQLLI